MDCIFCKIIENDIASYTIYEDQEFKVIFDRFPSSLGHVLILTKKHTENIFEIDPELAGRLFVLATKLSILLKETFKFDGLNILQNNGEIAGQTVYHFHLHLIPRYNCDNVQISWETISPSALEFEKKLEILKNKIEMVMM